MKEVYNRKANIVNIFLISSFFSLSLHYYPYLFIFFLISSFFPYLFIFFLISSFFSLSLHYFEYMSHLLLLYTPGENRVETFAIFNNVFFFYQGSQTLTIHRTLVEGTMFYSFLPLLPAHKHSDIYLKLCP